MQIFDLKTVYKITDVPAVIRYGGKAYDLGLFTIRIKKIGRLSGIKIERTKEGEFKLGNFVYSPHPHICRAGSICFGYRYDEKLDDEFDNDIFVLKLLKGKEYAALGDWLINFLNSYNEGEAYWELYNEYCDGCGELTEDCDCEEETDDETD